MSMKVSFNCKLNANRKLQSIFQGYTDTVINFYVLPSIHIKFIRCEQTGYIDILIDIEWLLWGIYLAFNNYSRVRCKKSNKI